MRAARALSILRSCAYSSERSLPIDAISSKISCAGLIEADKVQLGRMGQGQLSVSTIAI